MNTIKMVAASTKRFVVAHKMAVAVSVTALACLSLNHTVVKQHNDFLKEHNLYEMFYAEPEMVSA